MKRTVFLIFTLLLILTLSLSSFASARNGLCSCGREFARDDSHEHLSYDCLGCGRNYTSCTCTTCWCSSPLTRTETESGMVITTCDGCGLPCEECECKDRSYYHAMLDVEQGMAGNEIPNPQNAIMLVLAPILPFGIFLAAYFTVYRRRSDTRTRKNQGNELKQTLDRIDRESNSERRYALAKQLAESASLPLSDRDRAAVLLRKNEALAEAVEEEWIAQAVRENLRTHATLHRFGLSGSPERIAARRTDADGSVARSLIRWDTERDAIALFEAVTPLNGAKNNRLSPAGNTTRFAASVFEEGALTARRTDPSTEEERRETLLRILPTADQAALAALAETNGDRCAPLHDLPPEAQTRKMGDKTRFPGGMAR